MTGRLVTLRPRMLDTACGGDDAEHVERIGRDGESMEDRITIYALRDTSGIRYVGQTMYDLDAYLIGHPVARRLRAQGSVITIESLEVVPWDAGDEAETAWLARMRGEGHPVVNQKPPGGYPRWESPAQSIERRFWARIIRSGECWLWGGATCKGYGRFFFKGKTQYAHRVAYELLIGPIPSGYELNHLCDHRLCVNPDHLEPMTKADHARHTLSYRDRSVANYRNQNSIKTYCKRGHLFDENNTRVNRDGYRACRECQREKYRHKATTRAKKTPLKGEDSNLAVLTTIDILDIRARYDTGECIDSIAFDYNIDRTNVWFIGKRKTWRHIPDQQPVVDRRMANKDKTHCPYGHEYTTGNTYITRRGGRQCRLCKRERDRERNAKDRTPPAV